MPFVKTILTIIPYEKIYPPMNGGMQRCFHLLNQLCGRYEVTAIIGQDLNSFYLCRDQFPNIRNANIISLASARVPVDLFSLLPEKLAKAVRFRYLNRSLAGPADSNFLLCYDIVRTLVRQQQFDFIMLEDTSFNLSNVIHRFAKKVFIIYNAYNVDTDLATFALERGKISNKSFQIIQKRESSLHDAVHAVLACSEMDLNRLLELNHFLVQGTVIPNGVFLPRVKMQFEKSKPGQEYNILFCGALDYEPNQEGLIWFCRAIFPLILAQIPGVKLLIIGKGKPSEDLMAALDGNCIINYGMVDNVDDYYNQARVAVVPLLSGGGTRLKILEAMGKMVPVVSTHKGAEGIAYTAGKNILIEDEEDAFARAIVGLLQNQAAAKDVAERGYDLVKKQYDWNIIGDRLSQYMELLFAKKLQKT